MVLLDELNGLDDVEAPEAAAFCFCLLGVIPSFSFRAGDRIEANDENILNVTKLQTLSLFTDTSLMHFFSKRYDINIF